MQTYLLGYIGVWHLGSAVVLFVGGCMTFHGTITFAQLTAAYLYSEVVFDSAKTICEQIANVLENIGTIDTLLQYASFLLPFRVPELKLSIFAETNLTGCVGRFITLQDCEGSTSNAGNLIPPDGIWHDGMSLESVSFEYPSRDRKVLRDVSVQFPANQSTALVGSSGSGKSTVAALLTGVLQPSSGAVLLGSIDVRNVYRRWMRNHIALVPQLPTLFTASVFDNISYGSSSASAMDVEAAAKAADAHGFICRLPHGYDTMIKDSVLSGGQRQRIAIARALFRKPRVLVCFQFQQI